MFQHTTINCCLCKGVMIQLAKVIHTSKYQCTQHIYITSSTTLFKFRMQLCSPRNIHELIIRYSGSVPVFYLNLVSLNDVFIIITLAANICNIIRLYLQKPILKMVQSNNVVEPKEKLKRKPIKYKSVKATPVDPGKCNKQFANK